MAHRVDIVLADGTRRRGFVDLECPDVIKSANYAFRSNDNVLAGATIITGERSVYDALKKNGYNVAEPNAGSSVFSVRLRSELAQNVIQTASETGAAAAAVISTAVEYWIENGSPMEVEKRQK
ncbi:MAG: hypothetical protein PHS57_06315 [Alphaproteobacteria bacterium]|nr:hypothetical protein [Alphaproteobacteria bacterium]